MNKLLNKLLHTESNSIIDRIVSGTSWVLFGTIFSKISVFMATICIARILSKEVYGELSIIRSTIQLFVSLSGFGIGATATKFIAEYRRNSPEKVINVYFVTNIFVWIMAIIACSILILFSSSIATERLHHEELGMQLRIAGIILFFTLINGAQTGSLAGFEDFKRIAKCNILMGISEVLFLCIGAYLWGLTGAVIGFGLTYCVAWGYNSIGINRHLKALHIPFRKEILNIKLHDFNILYSFSLPLAAMSWMQMLTYWWMKTLVVECSGFSSMANYDIAEQWKTLSLLIPSMIASVILPVLSNVNDDRNRRKAIKLNFYINVGFTMAIAIFILIFGKWLILIYGTAYNNVWPVYILVTSAIFDSVSNLCGTILISSKKVPMALISNGVWAICLMFSFSIFKTHIPNLEDGLALSYSVASLVQAVVIVFIVKFKHLY